MMKPNYNFPLEEIRLLYPNCIYLDNAAAPLFPSSLPIEAANLLNASQPIVNPHSGGRWGDTLTHKINGIRTKVLELLGVNNETHEIVFCQNATAAIKIVGECLHNYNFYYSLDSHTSIIGLRELSLKFEVFDNEVPEVPANSVVSWCLQSNFNGKRNPVEWCDNVFNCNAISLLDISSFCSTEMPNLSKINCDLAVLSFYKIFGYPDLGALIIRKSEKVADLFANKRYFGGGTVDVLTPRMNYLVRKDSCYADMLEDGTIPTHTIICLQAAIKEYSRLFGAFKNITDHTTNLANYCKQQIGSQFGDAVVILPCDSSIVTFIIPSIGHNEFQIVADSHGVILRTGTLCNIGSFLKHANSTDVDIMENHKLMGKKCNDGQSFINDKHTGVIRVSMGPYTTVGDIDMLLMVIKLVFENEQPKSLTHPTEQKVIIEQLNVFPIKSCGVLNLLSSELKMEGLKFDREFCLVDMVSRSVMTMKKWKNMILIKPKIIDNGNTLYVEFDGKALSINRNSKTWQSTLEINNLLLNTVPVVVDFFSNALKISCTIACCTSTGTSMSNSSPLLVVNSTSARDIGIDDISVFRANIVVKSETPWAEDNWNYMELNNTKISIQGKCRRCNMICITNKGESNNAPYMQLCRHRKIDGRLYFGCHASLMSDSKITPTLKLNQILEVHT